MQIPQFQNKVNRPTKLRSSLHKYKSLSVMFLLKKKIPEILFRSALCKSRAGKRLPKALLRPCLPSPRSKHRHKSLSCIYILQKNVHLEGSIWIPAAKSLHASYYSFGFTGWRGRNTQRTIALHVT